MNGVYNGAGGHDPALYSWQEVTGPFLVSCQELRLGELLHDDMFGLFEAMSAIEMMDPKMDAGMVCNKSAKGPLSFQEAVTTGHLLLDRVEPELMIGIVDESLGCLVTWLEGHSLVQTVFTNLYLHQPEKIVEPTMRAFSYSLLKLVEVLKELISLGSVYEEEDHQPLICGFRLGSEVTNVAQLLKEAEDDIQKKIRATRPKEGEERDARTVVLHDLYTALAGRLRFLRLFYLSLQALTRSDTSEAVKQLQSCQETLTASVVPTVGLGAVAAGPGRPLSGFEPLANQRLLPPTFPRVTEIRERCSAIRYLQALVQRLVLVCNTMGRLQQQPGGGSFHAVLDFFQEFSAGSPCLVSRSVLQLLYGPLHTNLSSSSSSSCYPVSSPTSSSLALNTGSTQAALVLQDVLREACKNFIVPPALLPPPPRSPGQAPSPIHSLQVKQCLDTFFSQCARPFGLLLRACGHNRARQRDKMVLILEEFSTVQEEADKIDNMLNSLSLQSEGGSGQSHALFLTTWLLYHVIRVMVRYVLSGFELELYARHEYCYIFYYLHELLYPWLINCLHRADNILSEHNERTEARRRDKNKKKQAKSASTKHPQLRRPYLAEIASYQAHTYMCGGLFKLLVASRLEGKVAAPDPAFDQEQVRYEHRFGAFVNLMTPPLAPYAQYKEVLDMTVNTPAKKLYLLAARDFGQARHILETVQASVSDEEILNLITINKTNFVVASVLAKDSENRDLTFDFSLHQNFPTLRLS